MTRPIQILAPAGRVDVSIDLPASKSISNRALIIRTLCGEDFEIQQLSDARDTRILQDLIQKLKLNKDSENPCVLDCGMAGTVFRFLTARACLEHGTWLLTGDQRMLERPVGDLVVPLRKLGARIAFQGVAGFPPLLITGGLLKGGEVEVRADISSQFISALLMIAPKLPGGLKLILNGKIVSRPYIDMTLSLMDAFGVSSYESKGSITIPEHPYHPAIYLIEKDFSSASYWFEIVALNPGSKVFLKDLQVTGIQGDAAVVDFFRDLGVETISREDGLLLAQTGTASPSVSFDFTDYPDLFPAIAATCCALGVSGRFTGIDHLEFKESKRITVMMEELSKTGASCRYEQKPFGQSSIVMSPGDPDHSGSISISTHADHRLAMAFAPLALKWSTIQVDDPMVVGKSYPAFWEHLQKCGFRIEVA